MILSLIPRLSNIERRVDDLGSSQPSALSPNLLYLPPPKRLCFWFGLDFTKQKKQNKPVRRKHYQVCSDKSSFHRLLARLLTREVLFEVLGGTLTPSIDGGLFYPLRQSNRYPCNQICYARGAFQSQTLDEPNFYKWASFVHRIQYSCSIYCSAPNGCRSTNAAR